MTDDQAFAEALEVARKAHIIVVSRDDLVCLDKRTKRKLNFIEINTRVRKAMKK